MANRKKADFRWACYWIHGLALTMLCLLPVSSLFAADASVTPSLGLSGAYNDNILFSREDKLDDYYSVLTPGLELALATEIAVIEAVGRNDFYFYSSESDLDNQVQDYDLRSRSDFLERWTFEIGGSYRQDTTLDSELEETGIVLERSDRTRLSGNTSLGFDINERTYTEVGYRYLDTTYEDDDFTDYTSNVFDFRFERQLRNQIDSIVLLSSYTFRESDSSELDSYFIKLGWRRKIEERLTLRMFGGYRRTENYNLRRERSSTDRGVFDISLAYQWERSNISFGINRGLSYSATGNNIEVDRFSLRYWFNLTERTRFDFDGRLIFNRDDSDISDIDGRYFAVEPSLTYNLTETHRLSLAYKHANDYDDNLDNNKTAAQNQVWLTLKLVWPQKW
jgi:hypothetical protein